MTSTDLVKPSGHLEIEAGQDYWTREQVAALGVLGIKGATQGDLAVFFHYCQKTQLDPFSRQIYYIKRRENVGGQMHDKWTIQVGIDGFRVIRDRIAVQNNVTVDFEDTVWYDTDGGEHKVWLDPAPPAACRVVLVKHLPGGAVLRYPGVLRTAAYMAMKDGKPVSQWATQPDHMIEKCCEAFATRRAFPHDLSGVYIEEEQQHVPPPPAQRRVTAAEIIRDPEPEPEPEQKTAKPAAPAALGKLDDLMKSLQVGDQDDERVILEWLGGTPWNATIGQVRQVTSQINDFIRHADGDIEEARSAIWARYHELHGEEAAMPDS